jgi:hypothetical protein
MLGPCLKSRFFNYISSFSENIFKFFSTNIAVIVNYPPDCRMPFAAWSLNWYELLNKFGSFSRINPCLEEVQVKNLGSRLKPSIGSHTKVWALWAFECFNPHNFFSFLFRLRFFEFNFSSVIFEACGANSVG